MTAQLTRTERIILETLAKHERYVRTETLIELLWDYGLREPEDPHRTVRQHIMHLRRKIWFTGLRITNQPYAGYLLEIECERSQLSLFA